MKSRAILVGTFVSLAFWIGCGDDDSSDQDAGPDAGDASVTDSGGESGEGGSGGKGGTGGVGGKGGTGGKGGSGGAGSGGSGGGGSGGGGSGGSGGGTTYKITGTVSGLAGSNLKLKNNGGDELTVSGASFEFATKLASGADYDVTISSQPSSPTQSCTVANGSGEVSNDDVENVQVTCTTNKYKIKGMITGYTGSGLVIKNNGGDDNTPSGNSFEFATQVDSGAAYAVTVGTQPSTQTCAVTDGSGNVGGADVENVVVACHDKNTLVVEPRFGSAIATWTGTGASSYTVKLTTGATCDLETTSCPGFVEITNATSPATIPNLTNGTPYYFQLTANYPGGVKSLSNKTAARPDKPRYNGNVNAVTVAASDNVYAGGAFTRLSVHTGAAVPVHKTSGWPSEIPNFPIVESDVYSVASDGTGGYYIGGTFTAVAGQARSGLAHIKSDGTLDTMFAPAVTGNSAIVRTIAVNGSTVYVAGDFTQIGGLPRAGLAAIGTNGTVSTTWIPNPTGGTVNALAFIGSDVVVGGSFTNIAGQAQANLALLDGTTGALETWNPGANQVVNALATNGDIVYAGGEFTMIGGATRSRLAALNGTGAMAAQATAWDPGPDNAVTQIAYANNTVYIAGLFANVGNGTPAGRAGVAAINTSDNGTVKAWNPTITPGNNVTVLAASADMVYLGGGFTSVGGMPRAGAAAVNANGDLQAWNPNPDGIVEAYALTGDSVVTVGQYRGIGGLARSHLVGFNSTGDILPNWAPSADGIVYALDTDGTKVFVGGSFDNLGGSARGNVGAVDESGTLDSTWNPNADNDVYALVVDGTSVFAGGAFSNIGGGGRAGIAQLNNTNGNAAAWNPGANNVVRALAVDGTTVYAGGDFTNFGGQTRNHLGAATTASDAATAWNPNVTGNTVNSLAVGTSTVIAGGDFTSIGGTGRNYIAAIQKSDGAATAFNPAPTGIVFAVALDDGALYVAGEYLDIAMSSKQHMAGFDDQGDLRADYTYNFDLAARALAIGENSIYVGGDFTDLNAAYTSGFAVLPL